jgi:hypothetical protein
MLLAVNASEDRAVRVVAPKATLAITQSYSTRSPDGTITKTFVVEDQGAQNANAADVTIASVGISGDPSHVFTVVRDGCAGATLASGEACTVDVAFKTTSAAVTRTATLVVSLYDEGRSADGVFVALSNGR